MQCPTQGASTTSICGAVVIRRSSFANSSRWPTAVKVNDDEAELFPDLGQASSVAITRGERGCEVRIGSDWAECPGYRVKVADTVGAGDAFAAAFLHGLGAGWSAARTGDFANRLGSLVASRPGAVPEWAPHELE